MSSEEKITCIPLDAEDIISRNMTMYSDPDKTYKTVHSHHRVRWENTKKENYEGIRKIISEFPYQKSLEKQCAYWLRALVGIHFFQDANHRTATTTLNYILDENGVQIEPFDPDVIATTVDQSKELRKPPNRVDVSLENLQAEDELFELWEEFYKDALS